MIIKRYNKPTPKVHYEKAFDFSTDAEALAFAAGLHERKRAEYAAYGWCKEPCIEVDLTAEGELHV